MDLSALSRKVLKALKEKAEIRTLAESHIDGVTIVTMTSKTYGPETGIVDDAGPHPVERYPDEASALAGHAKWEDTIRGGATVVRQIEPAPGADVNLLRNSMFDGRRDIRAEDVLLRVKPFDRMAGELLIKDVVVATGDGDYLYAYSEKLRRRVIGMETPEPAPKLDVGVQYERQQDGTYAPSETDTADVVVAKRVTDFTSGGVPKGWEMDTCSRCSAMVAFKANPRPDLPLVCRQCGPGATQTVH